MISALKVDHIVSYLAESGWQRDPQGWRGAGLWRHSGDYEVLVPARDGMGDGERRIREILRCLSEVENRAAEDIVLEISRPLLDRQFFRTSGAEQPSGSTSLLAGAQAMQGIRNLLAAAARTVMQGPHFAFVGRPPGAVGDLLRAAELGPSRVGSYIVEVRLASDATALAPEGAVVSGRAVLTQMLEAVSAARVAVLADRPEAFDEMVTAGVSAELCGALSDLCGAGRNEPFEITLRWARAQPLDLRSHLLTFPEASGPLLQAAVRRLRGLNASGAAMVVGVVEGLYDDAAGDDRWRIKVRGELRTAQVESSGRAVWIRLQDQETYDRAITAHRQRRVITVTGGLSSTTGRVELVPDHRLEF